MTKSALQLCTPFLSLALANCTAPSEAQQGAAAMDIAGPSSSEQTRDRQTRAAAEDLLEAQPADWASASRRLLETSEIASPALSHAIRRNPAGPGLQVAVAILGKLGDQHSIPLLEALLRERSSISSEAALALGQLPAPQSRALLAEEMLYSGGSPLNRTCAAVALMDLGDRETSLPFLRAILLAGTPAGMPLQQHYGLPDRARWAHERFLAIAAIGRLFAGETFGLDPDSPWPRLEAAVERMDQAARKLR